MQFMGYSQIDAIKCYFLDVLETRITPRPWKGRRELPFFLLDFYNFYETSLLEKPCLLMVAKEGVSPTPATVRKHLKQVQEKWVDFCIYVQMVISTYNRKRLVEHHVPFLVPGNQMYLPDLGIDFREHFRKLRKDKIESFSPATQAVVIYALLQETNERYLPSQLAKWLGYSLMTMTRAFDELMTAGIGEELREGRKRWWRFKGNKHELWEQALPMMRNPVKKCTWLAPCNAIKRLRSQAGLSALSFFSMLNPPAVPIYAISIDEWKKLKQLGIKELPSSDEAVCELEIWHYNPELFIKNGRVDPFSLYLSLRTNDDERIGIALEEAMKKISW